MIDQTKRAVEPSTFTRSGPSAIPLQSRTHKQDTAHKLDTAKIEHIIAQKSIDNR